MKRNVRRYLRIGLTGFGILAAGLLFFFFLFRMEEVRAGLHNIFDIILPFIYGAVIAYILAPLCNKLERGISKLFSLKERKGWVSGVSIFASIVFLLAVVCFLFMLVIPQVWKSLMSLVSSIPVQLAAANDALRVLLEKYPDLQTYWNEIYDEIIQTVNDIIAHPDGLIEWAKENILPNVSSMMTGVGSGVAAVVVFLKNIFIGLLISVYFLASRKQFAEQGKMIVRGIFSPHWADLILEEVSYADKMFNGFLMGKLLDSAIIGMLCFVGTTLLGFEAAPLISVIVGVTNIIPFFGPFIGAIPCALLLLIENPMHALYFVIFIILLQQLDGNFIGPKILGNTTGLSSFWVLFAILLFGGLWNFVGMIIGVPLFAVIYDIIRKLVYKGLGKHGASQMIDDYNETFHPEPPPKKEKHPRKPKKPEKPENPDNPETPESA